MKKIDQILVILEEMIEKTDKKEVGEYVEEL